MKSTVFSRIAVSAVFVLASITRADACGPYNPIIPTPEFFKLDGPHTTMASYDKEENLKLWQSLTSPGIPLPEIEEVVYHDSLDRFYDYAGYRSSNTGNRFYIYLRNSCDNEIIDFLITAKRLEERWSQIRSPWHYPRSRESAVETGDFHDIIEECQSYKGTRLKDRYALQISRALFASRQYADCIEHYSSAFADIPEDNLFKRMAQRYAAGSWSRLGECDRADTVFAKAGDIWSIGYYKPAEFMATVNPDAPQLMEYIRENASDTTFMCTMIPLARKLIDSHRVKNTGDWYFTMSYVYNTFIHDLAAARKYICLATRGNFSTDELKDLAHAYKMKLDARAGNFSSLISDLRWLESKTDVLNPDAFEWVRRCRNIIYVDWIPQLWKKKDYATAILLCGYADNLTPALEIKSDYGNLSFQMMGSLSSAQLATVYSRITGSNPLYSFLRRKARTDRDYYYELIGTLAIREENYTRAEFYLSKVSDNYLKSMNIDKDGYLSRDPFNPYNSRWAKATYSDWEVERMATRHTYESNPDAKLMFARKMKMYRQKMSHGRTPDERGLARLMYAIGRRNSFEECWALTQYWRGGCSGIFVPLLQYRDDDFAENNYEFLYDYETTIGHKTTEKIYSDEVRASLAMLTSDEARAKAHYRLNNLATVVRHYGNTPTARLIKTSCDNWKSWL